MARLRLVRSLFLALATAATLALSACGSDSEETGSAAAEPEIPEGSVAVVDDVDLSASEEVSYVPEATVSRTDFEDGLEEGADLLGKDAEVPDQASDEYDYYASQALQPLLVPIWIEGEAAEREIVVTDADVENEFDSQQEAAGIRTEADLAKVLRQRDLTEEEVKNQIRGQVLQERLIEAAVGSETATDSPEFEAFQDEFFEKWTARTSCVPEAQSELCSGFEDDDSGDEESAPPESDGGTGPLGVAP